MKVRSSVRSDELYGRPSFDREKGGDPLRECRSKSSRLLDGTWSVEGMGIRSSVKGGTNRRADGRWQRQRSDSSCGWFFFICSQDLRPVLKPYSLRSNMIADIRPVLSSQNIHEKQRVCLPKGIIALLRFPLSSSTTSCSSSLCYFALSQHALPPPKSSRSILASLPTIHPLPGPFGVLARFHRAQAGRDQPGIAQCYHCCSVDRGRCKHPICRVNSEDG